MSPTPFIYITLMILFTIAILALRGAVLESNKTHRAQREEDEDVHTEE